MQRSGLSWLACNISHFAAADSPTARRAPTRCLPLTRVNSNGAIFTPSVCTTTATHLTYRQHHHAQCAYEHHATRACRCNTLSCYTGSQSSSTANLICVAAKTAPVRVVLCHQRRVGNSVHLHACRLCAVGIRRRVCVSARLSGGPVKHRDDNRGLMHYIHGAASSTVTRTMAHSWSPSCFAHESDIILSSMLICSGWGCRAYRLRGLSSACLGCAAFNR